MKFHKIVRLDVLGTKRFYQLRDRETGVILSL